MATPLSPDTLIAALKAEGITVVEHPGWRSNNRNSKGSWGPVNGVVIHHTVTTGTTPPSTSATTATRNSPAPSATESSPRTAQSTSWATAEPTTRAAATATY